MTKEKGTPKTVILEHAGIKVGDPVKLIGTEMPRTIGRVLSIKRDKYSDNTTDMVYTVMVKNEAEANHEQPWPVYRYELEKV